MMDKIHLAVVGTGKIVNEALPILSGIPEVELAAIYAQPHSREKGEQLAGQYGIGRVYIDYAELLRDETIDFVYVAVVNTAHFEMCRAALLAGKHVIVEKPMCPTADEVAELAALAVARGLYLFEAVTLLHSPNFNYITEHLKDIGQVRLVTCNYSQYSSRYDRYLSGDVAPAFDPAMAGGALYDINVYNINFVVGLFGAPRSSVYYPNTGFNGIDTSGVMILLYDNFVAECSGAKDSASPGYCTIQGEKGWLRMNGAPNQFRDIELHTPDGDVRVDLERHTHRMKEEFLHFTDIYRKGDYEQMRHYLTIAHDVARVLSLSSTTGI